MTEPKGEDVGRPQPDAHRDLEAFGAKLEHSIKNRQEPDSPRQRTAIGAAMRLSTELVAGVAIGTAIGWAIDNWLGTSPAFLVIFFFLGVAAGILNVVRTTQKMAAEAEAEAAAAKGNHPPNRNEGNGRGNS